METGQYSANGLDLLINGLRGPIVTDSATPVFTVLLDGQRLIRFCELTLHDENGQLVWTSGPQPFDRAHLTCAGAALRPKAVYKATAQLTDDSGAQLSCRTSFATGFLGQPWQAGWIEPPQEPAIPEKEISMLENLIPSPSHLGGHDRLRPCQDLRKTFANVGPARRAMLYASAHGVFELQLNGRKVGSSRLAPETSAYQKILYYQAYDVTNLLQPGDNLIEARLGDGWWIGRLGFSGDSCQYGDRLGFIMQLEIDGADGGRQVIVSDESFLARRSRTDYADLFIGERQDLRTPRLESWEPCRLTAASTDSLVAQPIAAVREIAALPACELLITPSGELVADFGQVMAGVVRLTVDCAEPCEIILDFCEVLGNDGNFYRNIIGRNKDQRDVFVCPPGRSVLEPMFTYHGFRYARISGIDRAWIKRAEAVVLGTPLEETGHFACSDTRLNQLQNNIRRSTRSNMFSVPTDCPQREKMGWTGDIQTYAKTGCFNFDLANFLDGWLANVRAEQLADGEVPMVVPNYPIQDKSQRSRGGGTSPAWGDACVLVPWYLYQCYGNPQVLLDNLPMMTHWLDYIADVAAQKPADFDRLTPEQQARNPYLWTKGYQFGDWLIPSLRKLPGGVDLGMAATRDVIGSCFYAVTVRTYLNVLDALAAEGLADAGLNARRTAAADRLVKIRQAVRDEYIADDGTIRGDLQGLYVLALYSGVAAGESGQKAAARLAELIEANGCRLDTGFVSTPYLLDVLDQAGRRDLALKLLFQTASPSWLYMVEHGATTIWENWEAILPDGTVTGSSFNHYSLGSVGDWIYRNIGGIAPAAPGYRHICFQPDIDCGLAYSECSHLTSYGPAACRWRWTEGECRIELEVPAGSTAELRARNTVEELTAGRFVFLFNEE